MCLVPHCVAYIRVPQDERNSIWRSAITAYSVPPHKGFVCVKHFEKDELIGKQRVKLKKDAVPKIFASVANVPSKNAIDSYECHTADELNDANQIEFAQGANTQYKSDVFVPVKRSTCMKCCNNAELVDTLRAEYANLKEEYNELESKRCVDVEKLKNELRVVKNKAEIRKQEIKYLSQKVSKLEKNEKSLKNLLKDLETQNILSTEAYEALEVNLHVFLMRHNVRFYVLCYATRYFFLDN